MFRNLFGAIAVTILASTAQAQAAGYVPSTVLPNGRQIVAVYIGAQSCSACHFAPVKEAIESMKTLVAAQARQSGASFAAIGVANDWDVKEAADFIATNGQFDQLVLGGNFTNLAIEQFVWRDPNGIATMPQILIIERTVKTGAQKIEISELKILRRLNGSEEIPAWVKLGAPIAESAKR